VFEREGKLLQMFNFSSRTCEDQQDNQLSLQVKVERYHQTWGNTLVYLYAKYLRKIPPSDVRSNDFELTPFTYLLATDFEGDITTGLELTVEDLVYVQSVLNEFKLDERLTPTPEKLVNFVLQVMLFPPLIKLSTFYNDAYQWHAESAKALLGAVVNINIEFPVYETNFALRFSNRFISEDTFKTKGGIEGLISTSELATIKEELLELNESVPSSKQLETIMICPHCGEYHDKIEINRDAIVYAHLKTDAKLHAQIGFSFYEAFQQDVNEALVQLSQNPNINMVKNSKCVILVEGATELNAIPILALRMDKPLATQNIQVVNCQSKEKLLMTFKSLRSSFPNLRICALLDSDAVKEKRDIEKMIAGHLDRFSLSFISKGTFEDLIPLPIIVQVLNTLYPAREPIEVSDFDSEKGIVKQISKTIWNKSNAEFDKVKFINEVVRIMNDEDVPHLLRELINRAHILSKGN
jgi:hypothetical protein